MKKTNILFGAVLLASTCTNALAQTFWDVPAGTTPTHTLGHIGIGTPTPITDAKLHIFNNPCDFTVPEQTIERWYWSGGYCSILGSHPNYFEIKQTIATPGGGSTTTLIDAFDDQGWLKITPSTTGAPGRAKLHISGYSGAGIPEIKMDRTGSATSDYMQIWNTTTGGTPTSTKLAVFDHRGWLGINTSSPLHALHVNGNGLLEGGQLYLNMPTDGGWRNVDANSYIHGVTMSAGPEGAYMQLRAKYNSDPGAITIACGNSENGTGTTFFSFDGASGPWHHLMRIKPNGKVAIGESIIAPENLPNGYKLYVAEGILTEKVKVATVPGGNWSDFVFDADYDLMPLAQVENFIKSNKHLPEIPSAADVEKDGVDMVTMDAKLLQKIEELTLYVIQQQKEIVELKNKIGK